MPKPVTSASRPGLAIGPTQPFVKEVSIIFLTGDGEYLDQVLTSAIDGILAIPMTRYPAGDYEVILSAEGALDKSVVFKYDPTTGVSDLDFSFEFGDLNKDNKITQDEADFVKTNVGKKVVTGQEWMGDSQGPVFPGMADFDQDGVVTDKDLQIIEANVGKVALKPKSLFEK
jgi:hypothetical protein